MKKILLLLSLLLLAATANVISAGNIHYKVPAKETYVYLCDSETAHVYHSTKDCRGLSHCTHRIIKVTLDEAIHKYDRRACKLCE
jgi:hypothetical protein